MTPHCAVIVDAAARAAREHDGDDEELACRIGVEQVAAGLAVAGLACTSPGSGSGWSIQRRRNGVICSQRAPSSFVARTTRVTASTSACMSNVAVGHLFAQAMRSSTRRRSPYSTGTKPLLCQKRAPCRFGAAKCSVMYS